MELIKAFMKAKENEENIYKVLKAWLRNRRSIIAFMKKGDKGYKERDRKQNALRADEQFLMFFK